MKGGASGYVLAVDPSAVDAIEVCRLAELTSTLLAAGDSREASAPAQPLWRCFVARHSSMPARQKWIRPHRARLIEVHEQLIEDTMAARLEMGATAELIGELEALVQLHPLRERIRGQLMLALYRAGRQADALRALSSRADYARATSSAWNPAASFSGSRRRSSPTTRPSTCPTDGCRCAVCTPTGEPATCPPQSVPSSAERESWTSSPNLVADAAAGHVGRAGWSRQDAPRPGGRRTGRAQFRRWSVVHRIRTVEIWQRRDCCRCERHSVSTTATACDRMSPSDGCCCCSTTASTCSTMPRPSPHNCSALDPASRSLRPAASGSVWRERCCTRCSLSKQTKPQSCSWSGPAPVDLQSEAVDQLDAIARICDQLDRMPLALELAAARTRSLSLDEIVERVDDRFALLTGGDRTAAARHQTLRGVVDWSYELLFSAEQRVLSICVDLRWRIRSACRRIGVCE